MAKNGKKERMGYFRLAEEQWARLRALAEQDRRPVSQLARKAIEQYLNRRKPAA